MSQEIDFETCFVENSTTTRGVIRKYIIRHDLIPYECACCGNDGTWQGEVLTLHLDHINGINNDHRLENLRWLCPNCHAQTDTYTGHNKTYKEKIHFTEEQAIEALKNTANVNQATKYLGCRQGGANWIRVKAIKNKFNIIQDDDIKKITNEKEFTTSDSKPKLLSPKYFCEICKRPISTSNAKICQLCLHEKQRKCNWPSREELKDKVRKMSFLQIGREYNVSDNAVRKWCKYYLLPSKKTEINKYSDEEWELI